MKDFTIELTKHQKVLEVNNSMCHNFYYLQYGRIYNADKTRFRKFKFVFWFDIFDVTDYFEKDIVTKQEISDYANEIAWSYCDTYEGLVKSFNDCKAFYSWCNETINNYNNNYNV